MKYWNGIDNKLQREFSLSDFKSCIDFVNAIARIAEKLNHHPEIYIYSYNKVKVTTYTFSENRVSEKDVQLCQMINAL